MNNLDRMMEEAQDFKSFAQSYFSYLAKLCQGLDLKALDAFRKHLQEARREQRTVFVIGNGGSAATASHMANDLGFGVRRHVKQPLKVLSLTDNLSTMTALANDVGYEQVFVRQLQLYAKPKDVLIVISASGNSKNLLEAARWFKRSKGTVLGLLGFDGGKLLKLCAAAVVVRTPVGEYGPVEDVHMILDHLLHTWFWTKERRQDVP